MRNVNLFFSQKPATTVKKLLSVFNVSLSLYVRMKESHRMGCSHVREKYEDIKGSVAAALTNTENYQ